MKRINIISGILGILLISSCELEAPIYENITGSAFPEKPEQLESFTLGAYRELSHLLDDWGWWLYNQEVSSDFLVFPQRGTDWEDGGKWRVLHRHSWNSTTTGIQNMWTHLYAGVTKCNQIIELLGTVAETEATLKVKAEMVVLRSFFYYLLIDNYGAVPYLENFNDAPKSPFRTQRADIYERLVKIVSDALPLLSEPQSVGNQKVTKAMAWMLLSKLYLNGSIYKGEASASIADMDSVIKFTNNVIAANYKLETDRLGPFKVNNSISTENIFTVLGDKNSDDGMRISFRTLHTLHIDAYDLESSPWNGCAVKPDFYEKHFAANDGFSNPDDNTSVNAEVVDTRSRAFLKGQQYALDGTPLKDEVIGNLILTQNIKADIMNDGSDGAAVTRFSGYRVTKFEVEIGSGPIMNNDFPFFRLADAYLMRAEATLRGGTGAAASADADLNKIRNAAGLPNVIASLDEVLNERGRELFLEGHRRSDLIRFGKFAARDWWLGANDSDPGNHRLIFPLPQDQVDVNSNLSLDPIPYTN